MIRLLYYYHKYFPAAPISLMKVSQTVIVIFVLLIYSVAQVYSDKLNILSIAKQLMLKTHNRKLALPRGSLLDFAPTLQIPLFSNSNGDGVSDPQRGINVNTTWHFYMFIDNFGKPGVTEDYVWPPIYPFAGFYSHGRLPNPRPVAFRTPQNDTAGQSQSQSEQNSSPALNSTNNYSKHRKPRGVFSLPTSQKLVGGERATFIPQLEAMLNSFGCEGRPCLLRFVCELHEISAFNPASYGLLGEIMTLLFRISESDYADSHLPEYLKAEEAGENGECSSYFTKCPKSAFIWEKKQKNTQWVYNLLF